jgi:hypothetical protein
MELKTIKREIDGLVFYINQFPARKSIKLEKRTITYLAPMLTMLEGFKSLDDDIDFTKIIKGIQEVLTNLDEETLEQFIFDMIEFTSVSMKDANGVAKSISLKEDGIFDSVFIGKTITVYKLLLEIMKVNKFAFFELMGGGGEGIGIFGRMIPKVKES